MDSELKACPLCAEPMKWSGQLFLHQTERTDCPIGDIAFAEHRILAWNTRAPDAKAETVADYEAGRLAGMEQAAVIAEDIEMGWSWGPAEAREAIAKRILAAKDQTHG